MFRQNNKNIRDQETTIDYALVNRKMFNYYKNIKIYENKEMFDLSDHCMIDLTLELEVKNWKKKKNHRNKLSIRRKTSEFQ